MSKINNSVESTESLKILKNNSYILDSHDKKKSINSIVKRNAQIIKSLRIQKGYTLVDLARLSGLSASYISRLESSDRRLNTDVLSKLALALGCKEDDFFKGNVDDLECSGEIGFQKNLPIYRIISEGINVADNPHAVIVFNSVMGYTFRPPKLSFSDTGFAVYCVNNFNLPRFHIGDMLFFDIAPEYKINDVVMIVDNKGYVFIGVLSELLNHSFKISFNNDLFNFDKKSVNKVFKLVMIEFE